MARLPIFMGRKQLKRGMKVLISTDVRKTHAEHSVVRDMKKMIGKKFIIDFVDIYNNIIVIKDFRWHPDDIIPVIDNKAIKVSDTRSFIFDTNLLS